MKHNKNMQDQSQKSDHAPQPVAVANSSSGENDFTPSPDEVARKAYFSYLPHPFLRFQKLQFLAEINPS